jgi:two-component system, LytTR family, response regulator LytT
MTLLRVLAVDDEPPALSELRYLVSDMANVASLTAVSCPGDALAALQDQTFDVLLLDIEMAEASGLEIAARLQSLKDRPAIVFVTAYAEHAVQAFELDAVDYVLKPVRRDRLAQALQRVEDRLGRRAEGLADADTGADAGGAPDGAVAPGGVDSAPGKDSRIAIETGGRTVFLERAAVAVVEASRDYVKLYVHREQGEPGLRSHLLRTPISVLEAEWSHAGFVRVHRSYLVAIREVRELRSDAHGTVLLAAGMEIPVGRTYLRPLKDRLLRSNQTTRRSSGHDPSVNP